MICKYCKRKIQIRENYGAFSISAAVRGGAGQCDPESIGVC